MVDGDRGLSMVPVQKDVEVVQKEGADLATIPHQGVQDEHARADVQ